MARIVPTAARPAVTPAKPGSSAAPAPAEAANTGWTPRAAASTAKPGLGERLGDAAWKYFEFIVGKKLD
ncbi:MAG: hypothetical protein K1X89_14635 [Myxococcaceae bacterium]|nr:hypothetical protein [Myxococcaceae bacterium]